MIEINLAPNSKKASINNVGGLDLSLLNIKMLVFAFLLLYIPEGYITDYYDGEILIQNTKQKAIRNNLRKLQTQVRSMEIIEKQANALKDQEDVLARKLKVVREVISKRQNPYKVLQYVAENTPKDIWYTELRVDDRQLTIRGYSKNFTSISSFLDGLKSSIFFSKGIKYSRPTGAKQSRYEVFEISATIVSFK